MAKICVACNKEIEKGGVTIDDKLYHADCFVCVTCSTTLVGKPCMPHDGKFYCESHYPEYKFCGHCEEKLTGGYIEALGKFWHEDHFRCSDCGGDFPDDEFHVIENNPYCKPCYTLRTSEQCSVCSQGITGPCYELNGKKIHTTCYTCQHSEPHELAETDQVGEYEGKIYCLEHLSTTLGVTCCKCNEVIKEQYIKIKDKLYHHKCWTCEHEGCNSPLNSETVKAEAAKGENGVAGFYCSAHAAEHKPSSFHAPSTSESSGGSAGGAGGSKAAATGSDYLAAMPNTFYPLEVLKGSRGSMPSDVDYAKREQYLDDQVFQELFGMDKAQFSLLPAWRKKQRKQKLGLF